MKERHQRKEIQMMLNLNELEALYTYYEVVEENYRDQLNSISEDSFWSSDTKVNMTEDIFTKLDEVKERKAIFKKAIEEMTEES
jgi:hypothetical protein